MRLGDFLGMAASTVIKEVPFDGWSVDKVFIDDPEIPAIHYIFRDHDIEFSCDKRDIITSIFIDSDKSIDLDTEIAGLNFNWNRQNVLAKFGNPETSRPRARDSIHKNYGGWDRFSRGSYMIHVGYNHDTDRISKVTIMSSSVAP